MEIVTIEKSELIGLIENSIRRVISNTTPKPKAKPKTASLSINNVADLTGYTLNTLYSKVHKNTIPYHKIKNGNKLIFFESEIIDWMQGRKLTIKEKAEALEKEFNKKQM